MTSKSVQEESEASFSKTRSHHSATITSTKYSSRRDKTQSNNRASSQASLKNDRKCQKYLGNEHLARIYYGDLISLNDGRQGTVRYIGTRFEKHSDIWYGISLTDETGKHDGTYKNVRYWADTNKHGIFISPKQIHNVIKCMLKLIN